MDICREQYGSQPVKRRYVQENGDRVVVFDDSVKLTSPSQIFRSVFLPQGYPDSVSEDYLQYQIWDTVQAFCSSITGTLATHAVLQGVGVGDEDATVLAATLTWLMKNGSGMLGQILFAWLKGRKLDSDCKQWRLFADILNDAAIFLELMAPLFQAYFRLVVCVAGVCKSIVGVAGGATRAALTQHQARRNNMADVSAKDGSQETLVNLAALLCSLILMPLVSGNQLITWLLYFTFTGFHLFANYRAVKSVCMETFNHTRLHIVVKHYLSSGCVSVLPVQAANRMEPVVFRVQKVFQTHLGCSASSVFKSTTELQQLQMIYQSSGYLLNVDMKTKDISVVLHKNCTVNDQLAACFQAEILEFAFRYSDGLSGGLLSDRLGHIGDALKYQDVLTAIHRSAEMTSELLEKFLTSCHQVGWKFSYVQLGSQEWRAEWDAAGLKNREL